MKKTIAAAFAAMMLLTGCGQQVVINEEPAPPSAQETSVVTMGEPANHTLDSIPDTSDNTIVITLRPDCAPLTCENFEKLVNDGFYTGLLLSGKLNAHLEEIDRAASEMFDLLIEQYTEREGVTEELKAPDQMERVRRMNGIRERVEEVVCKELIYT